MPSPQFIQPLDPCDLKITRCPTSRSRASRRILIMGLGALGDIIAQSPLLTALRASYPDCWLTWMVEHMNREAVDAHPCVDEILLWDSSFFPEMLSRRWKNLLKQRRTLGLRWLFHALRLTTQLRLRRFDVYISLQPEKGPLMLLAVGAKTSVGIFPNGGVKDFSRAARRYTHSYTQRDLPLHPTHRALLALKALALSAPEKNRAVIGFTESDAGLVEEFLVRHDITAGDGFAVLAPTTTWPTKRWSPVRYASLSDLLAQRLKCRVILTGTETDSETLAEIAGQSQTPVVVAAGAFSFRQLAALIARASVLVSGDTGPMHAAAAVGTPYVALFGPTMPERHVPLGRAGKIIAHPIPCAPCYEMRCVNTGSEHMRCMHLIEVQEVLAAALACAAPPNAASVA